MKLASRTIATAATAAALALSPVAVSAASAATIGTSPYPQPTISCTISVTTTPVGTSFTVSCTGLPPGTVIIIIVTSVSPTIPDSAISIAGERSTEVTAGANGVASGVVTLNAAGTYTIAFRDRATNALLSSQTVTAVAPAAAPAAASGLSSTGTDVLPIALGAGALLAVGAGTVVLVRRRKTV